jgi:hypothetical protein
MAIQNFLSGGFIGKLGETVGQRWRNKRTIRVHVPHNTSNTELQKSARAMFKKANKLAQTAMNFNKGLAAWQSPENNEWSLRVGTAMRRLRAGLSDQEATPYFPDNINQAINISVVDFSPMSHFSNAHFVNNTVHINTARTLRFSYFVYDIATLQMVTKTLDIPYSAGSSFSADIPNNGSFLWVKSSWIEAESLNDSQFGGTSITLSRQLLASIIPQNISVPVAFGTPSWSTQNKSVAFTASVPESPLLYHDFDIPYFYKQNGDALLADIITTTFHTENKNTITIDLQWSYAMQFLSTSGFHEGSTIIDMNYYGIRLYWPDLELIQPSIPLPDTINIANVDFSQFDHFQNCALENNNVIIPVTKTLRLSYYVYDIATSEMVIKTRDVNLTANTSFSAAIPNDGSFLWVNSSWIEGASLNDSQFGDMSITLERQYLSSIIPQNISVPVAFGTPSWSSGTSTVSFSATIENKPLFLRNIAIPYRYMQNGSTPANQNATAGFFAATSNIAQISLLWSFASQFTGQAGIEAGSVNVDMYYFGLEYTWSALPLSQPSTPVDPTITLGFNFEYFEQTDNVVLFVLDDSRTAGRSVSVSARLYNPMSATWHNRTFNSVITNDRDLVVTFNLPPNEIFAIGSTLSLDSTDDASFNDVHITLPTFTFTNAHKPQFRIQHLDMSITWDGSYDFYASFNIPIQFPDNVDEVAECYYRILRSNNTTVIDEADTEMYLYQKLPNSPLTCLSQSFDRRDFPNYYYLDLAPFEFEIEFSLWDLLIELQPETVRII